MSVASPASSLLERSRKARPRPELVCEAVFRPLAHLVVLALLPLRISPPAVVAAGAAAGLAAAIEIGRGDLIAGALLLQLKTVLDNADGQLARASGRVSAFGRYLDTESDLVVNAAVFCALGYVTGRPLLALAAFVCLTVVLAVDFNLARLFRGERGEALPEPAVTSRPGELLAGIYRLVFAPGDRLAKSFVESRLANHGSSEAARLAYHDPQTLSVLANLGLSTQLFVLGVCLVAGAPSAYLWLAVGCAGVLLLLLGRRERLARAAARAERVRSGGSAEDEPLPVHRRCRI